jgi:hypothetical protein
MTVSAAPAQKGRKGVKAFVRSKVMLCRARLTNFLNRNLPVVLDLPKLPVVLTQHSVLGFLDGRGLSNALGTCEKIRGFIAQNPEWRSLVERTKLSHLLLSMERVAYI